MTDSGKAAGDANDMVEAARAVVGDEERMAALLAAAQPLPKATRNKIVDALAPYDPPVAWREEEIFYSWLRTHYAQHGRFKVDEVLKRRGGNDSRRLLLSSTLKWSGQELVKRGLPYTKNPGRITALARQNGLVDVLAVMDFVRNLPATEPEAEMNDPSKMATVDDVISDPAIASATSSPASSDAEQMEVSNVAQLDLPAEGRGPESGSVDGRDEERRDAALPDQAAAIATIERILARLQANPLPQSVALLLSAAERVEAELDEAENDARRRRDDATRLEAFATLSSAIANVSEMRRIMLEGVGVAPTAATAALDGATRSVLALIDAEAEAALAALRLKDIVRVGPERRAAIKAEQDAANVAEERLEAAFQALEAIRSEGDGQTAAGTIEDACDAEAVEDRAGDNPAEGAWNAETEVSQNGATHANASLAATPDDARDDVAPGTDEAPSIDEAATIYPDLQGAARTTSDEDASSPGGILPDQSGLSADGEVGPSVLEDPDRWVASARPESVESESVSSEARPWDDWISRSLDADLLGLAVHLADGREIAGATVPTQSWPAAVLEAALASRSIESHADSASGHYAELTPQLVAIVENLAERDSDAGMYEGILAGALRASLVAPYAGRQVVAALRAFGRLPAHHRLMDFADKGPQLNISTVWDLSPMDDRLERERQHGVAHAELERWYRSARTRTLAYQPATAMWQRELIVPNGKIGRPVEAIIRRDENAETLARDLTRELRERPEQLLDEAFDAQLSKSRAVRLEAAARERCLGLLDETRELVETWLATLPTGGESRDRLERPRAELAAGLKETMSELGRPMTAGTLEAEGAALLLDGVSKLKAITEGVGGPPLSTARTLDNEIALLADFPLNGRRRLRIGIDDVDPLRVAADRAFRTGTPSWRASFERSLETGAATVANRVLPLMADQTDADVHRLEAMKIQQRRELEARRASLRNRLDDLQMASSGSDETGERLTDFETALISLGEEPLDEYPLDNTGVEGSICDFPVLRSRLDVFEGDLEDQRALAAASLEERIVEAERRFDVRLVDCRSLLAAGDLGTLVEDLDQLQSHRPGEPSVRHRHLIRHLEHFVDHVLTMDLTPITALHHSALEGERHGPLRYDLLHLSEREAAARLIDAWIAFKRAAQASAPALEQTLTRLLSVLGFGGARVVRQIPWRGGRRFEVATDPIRSAASCMIPTFGSQADGNYTILVIPEGSIERCLQGFDELPAEIIAFSAEWLSPNARQSFLRVARGRPGASVALLDEAGIAALSATSGRGLRHFFDLAVPFGAAHPYVDTSLADAAPSIEMFFGREREYEQLFDAQGSCLVYGGRQLGKTALLKQIQMRNVANPDLVVIYLSIENLGRSVQSLEVWNHLSQQLYEHDVLTTAARGEQAVCAGIRQWLAGSPTRRLLMLLDEADNFLEHEINTDFAIIGTMRRLMEETGRRAKFVYAGLHNVQRFVRTPNSPMLHLGNAVQIGPLLGHDREAARRMVFDPMAAIGIGFEHAADAHHILSLVGYYPSLVQTFGKTIVAKEGEDLKRLDTLRLPRTLRRENIIESFQDTEFRKALIAKFRATLQLDRRYELITYAVCFRVEEDRRNRVGNAGYTEAEIRRSALEHWPQGFASTNTADVFEALLDEMVGLGVLNRDGDRFTLRSARIAAMLGGSEQIFDQLVQFSDKPPEHKSDPMANHRSLSLTGTYAPLSLRQERSVVDHLRQSGGLASTMLIAGPSAVADLGLLAESIRGLVQAQEWAPPRQLAFRSMDDLRKVISGMRKEAREGRPRVILCQGRWPSADEIQELAKMKELKDAGHPVRLVFLGDAGEIVRAERSGAMRAYASAGTMVVDVKPWDREAVHHWLTRHVGTPDNDLALAERVWLASGGYSGVLGETKRLDRLSDDEVVERVTAAAAKIGDPAFLGFADPWLSTYLDLLSDYGEEFSEDDLSAAAKELKESDPAALVRATIRLGLLRETQRSGEPRFGFPLPVSNARERRKAIA